MKIQGLIRGFLQRKRNKKAKLEEADEKQVRRSDDDQTPVSGDRDNPKEGKKRYTENPALA